ncbi:leucine rich repeat containing 51 isoform X1 [Silurus meridionalis]|uniref:leucine rich repeat containing 51 isoform X1 n=2 Tax=Silurus meridionalis TaxID=175797 RepID=UPI001EECB8A1|nr:leucine rich repeat containing 51 isoform X1 [Silurus meridionalis]XP_046719071.1 leucine rich repeat containing 51 isoform X1 [Silurus meridionalis]XP_046719072.1 leucine rich repeat containing 51 isoform X1 [Silurus meridionalis]XP_046719073.1 leucine rich repeat containing 51 isoform X1 [Silurus meridionalis]
MSYKVWRVTGADQYLGDADVLAEEPNKGMRVPWRTSEGKFASQALRLNNNLLTDTTGLMETLSALFVEPKRLAWLDLSFNKITHIHPVLTELAELRVLYLHGNSMCSFSEVDKLGALPLLHTITLHGNSIETEQGYRNYVITALPHLKMMDFSVITKQDRIMASIWHRPPRNRKPTNRSAENISKK